MKMRTMKSVKVGAIAYDTMVAKLLATSTSMARGISGMAVSKILSPDENALLHSQNFKGYQKSQSRFSATETAQNNMSNRADFNANPQRKFHQMLAFQPELMHAYSPEVPEVRQIDCDVAEMSDKVEIVEFVCKYFLKREPLMKALDISAEEARSFVEYNVKDALKDKSSFVARDECGRMCGIRLNAVGHAEEMGKDVQLSRRLRTLIQFLSHTDGLLPKEFQTSRFMRHIAICVNPDIARSGVGTLMMRKSVEFSKKHQLKYMIAMCSGKIATGLASKVGFRVVKEIPYSDYVDPTQSFTIYSGNMPLKIEHKPFLSLAEMHTSAKLMVRNV